MHSDAKMNAVKISTGTLEMMKNCSSTCNEVSFSKITTRTKTQKNVLRYHTHTMTPLFLKEVQHLKLASPNLSRLKLITKRL